MLGFLVMMLAFVLAQILVGALALVFLPWYLKRLVRGTAIGEMIGISGERLPKH